MSRTARGGIGEIMGRFIDAEGGVVDSEINRMINSSDIRQNQCRASRWRAASTNVRRFWRRLKAAGSMAW